jgi:hypothetical protein
MNTHKPEPLFPEVVKGKLCPACGKRSYSPSGVHPQCAVKMADAPRQRQLAEAAAKERARRQAEHDAVR